jgi:hypothetical protein
MAVRATITVVTSEIAKKFEKKTTNGKAGTLITRKLLSQIRRLALRNIGTEPVFYNQSNLPPNSQYWKIN